MFYFVHSRPWSLGRSIHIPELLIYPFSSGFSKFNMIYEFNYSILGNNNVQMVMTSVSGHLLNLEFTSSYRGWRQCSPLALFDAPVQSYCPENYNDIKRTLEKEIRGCHGEWYQGKFHVRADQFLVRFDGLIKKCNEEMTN